MEIPRPGDTVETGAGPVRVEHPLGKGKSAHSFLARRAGKRVVLKVMHDEPNPYYRFGDDRALLERRAYDELLRVGVPVPRLLHFDGPNGFLLKEYVPGRTAAERIAGGEDPAPLLPPLFALFRLARSAGRALDWFPTNFVPRGEGLVYIDYEVNEYHPEWNLENWGLYYWANGEGMAAFFRTGDPSFINDPPESPHPVREPFRAMVRRWADRYGNEPEGGGTGGG